MRKRIFWGLVLLIVIAVLIYLFRGSGEQSPAATPGPGTEIPFMRVDLTQTAIEASRGQAPPVQIPAGLSCYPIYKGDWPLKVLRRQGLTTQPGYGPYSVLDKYGNVRVNQVPDWGYIGEVYPGEQLCLGVNPQMPVPTATNPVVPTPTPSPTYSPTVQPDTTQLAIAPDTFVPTSTPQPGNQPTGLSPTGKILLGFFALVVLALFVRYLWRRRGG